MRTSMEKYSAANTVAGRVLAVRERIEQARRRAGRRGRVTLVAVGKTRPASRLLQAYLAGVRHFGESYLQEALPKQAALGHCDITWHFIGPIQSNKTRPIAAGFHWVHGVDRVKIARRLSDQRPPWLPPLNVCLQVNVSGEASKAGVAPEALEELVEAVIRLPCLRLRGLMTIPARAEDEQARRAPFQRLRQLMEALSLPGVDTLSMGMSADLEAAVEEGATLVRVGTAIFGPRGG